MKYCIYYIFLLHFLLSNTYSQCFTSPGNPIGGNLNMGVVNKHSLRVASFYKHSTSSRYFFGDELYTKKEGTTFDRALFDYLGGFLAYGITEKLTLETEFGYFIDKKRYFPVKANEIGNGFSNALITAKYKAISNLDKRFETTLGIGGKIPLRHNAQTKDGVELATEAQSSGGAYGVVGKLYVIKEIPFQALRFFLIAQYEHNFPSIPDFYEHKQYEFGNALTTSLFISKHLHLPPSLEWLSQNWTAILQIRNEIKGKNKYLSKDITDAEWKNVPNSGSVVFFMSPQLNYTLEELWNISITFDIPLYQYYQKKQMAIDYAFNINVTRDILF